MITNVVRDFNPRSFTVCVSISEVKRWERDLVAREVFFIHYFVRWASKANLSEPPLGCCPPPSIRGTLWGIHLLQEERRGEERKTACSNEHNIKHSIYLWQVVAANHLIIDYYQSVKTATCTIKWTVNGLDLKDGQIKSKCATYQYIYQYIILYWFIKSLNQLFVL